MLQNYEKVTEIGNREIITQVRKLLYLPLYYEDNIQ